MGNRAVIAFSDKPTAVGIYLHWNGGRASVDGFLKAARDVGVPKGDESYALARITQLIGNFFGGNFSVGVGILRELDCDNGDNGLYIVDPATLEIKGRKYGPVPEEINDEKTAHIAALCVKAFPLKGAEEAFE